MSIPDETLARWAAWPRPGTPGPWETGDDHGPDSYGMRWTNVYSTPTGNCITTYPSTPDARFIALAPEMREAIDVLVAEVRELRAACEVTVREMERYYRDGSHPDLSPVLRASKAAIRGDA